MAGIPYMGSKRKLAHRIVDVIFNRHNSEKFYDLFGGGWLFRQTAVSGHAMATVQDLTDSAKNERQ